MKILYKDEHWKLTKMEIYLGKLELKQVSLHQNVSLIEVISIDELSRQIKKTQKR